VLSGRSRTCTCMRGTSTLSRPSVHEIAMTMAEVCACRATCSRRAVGAVITSQSDQVLGTGYNGPARGQPHCVDFPCAGSEYASGQGLDSCEAVHAEQNAIVNTSDMSKAHNIYVTTAPCVSCTKLLLNTHIKNIYYANDYPQSIHSQALWSSDRSRTWRRLVI
jgi:dCMP deaminase